MWQFREAVRGLADGCAELTTPVTGGNVSFYNQTGNTPILPTPVVAVLGTIDDASTRIPQQVTARVAEQKGTDFDLILVGKKTQDELGGSIWQQVAHDNALAGMPPKVNLADEQKLAELMSSLRGKVVAASDLSEGGLSQALVELAVQSDFGLIADPTAFLAAPVAGSEADAETIAEDMFVGLFSETASRILLVVERDKCEVVLQAAEQLGLAAAHIGSTGTKDAAGQAQIVFAKGAASNQEKPAELAHALVYNLDEVRSAWEATLPALFSHAAGNNSVIE